jgi:phosphosulfolactate synthase (CoM biosynthesis protein A)
LIDLAHSHEVYVSAGGFMEHLLTHPEVFTIVDRYLQKCKDVGFDVIELLSDFHSFPPED